MKSHHSLLALLAMCAWGCKPPPTLRTGVGSPAGGTGDLGNFGAPQGIERGTQLVYWDGGATIPGQGKTWKMDDDGSVVDEATGQRYSGESKQGSGGTGYSEYTVLAIEDGKAVLSWISYLSRSGSYKTTNELSITGPSSSPAGFWFHPQFLQTLTGVTRGSWNFNGKMVDAVMQRTETATGKSLSVYSSESGLMLLAASVSVGAQSPIVGPGETSNSPDTMLSQVRYSSTRKMAPPWANDPEPDVANTFHEMVFEGTQNMFNTNSPAMLRHTYSLKDRGEGWVLVKAVISTGAPGAGPGSIMVDLPSEFATGRVMPHPLWIHPTTLAKLQVGQVVDQDPVTQIIGKVDQPTQGPRGQMVSLVFQNSAETHSYGYDLATGLLVYMKKVDLELNITDEVTLKSFS